MWRVKNPGKTHSFNYDLDRRYTKTLTGTEKNTKKKNKPLDAPNIDRHKKNKNSNYSEVHP